MMRPIISRSRFLFLATVLASACGALADDTHRDYLSAGDDSLYYEVSGQGFPLVLVSGGSGMDLRQWNEIVPDLTPHFQVITYDPRGIGRSDNPTEKYSDSGDLVELLNHLGLERVGLIGLSSAGGFVLEFAVENPSRVAGVVASAPFIPGFEFSEAMLARLAQFNQATQNGRESYLDSIFADPHFIPSPLNELVRSIAREIMGENFDKGAGFDPALQMLIDPPLIEQLGRIAVPVLLLAGELDHPEVLRRNKYLVGRIAAAHSKVLVQAGHNIPLENPRAFLTAIDPFLKRLSPD